MLVLYWARATSGTLPETHASYAAMYSSHSGTPIFSPEVLTVVAGVDAGVAFVAGGVELLLFTVTSVLPQATSKSPITTHNGSRILFFIWHSLSSGRMLAEQIKWDWKSGGTIHEIGLPREF